MIDNLIALALSTTIIGLVMGIVYQTVSRAADQRKYPPSGQLIDIGGFRLHFNCAGQGRPTVVMDAGGGAPSISWGLVPSEIAKFTRVCTYDRAGFGWSEPNLKAPRSSQQSVDELHKLLTKAKIEPPYILVGHSLGGANMRLYASQHPEDVVGLVLVDSVHEDQVTPEQWKHIGRELWFYQALRIASRVGLVRLIGETNLLPILEDLKKDLQKYPLVVQALFDTFKSHCYCPHYWATLSSERANIRKSFEQLREVTSLDDLPLIVLSQGSKAPEVSDERFQRWAKLQADLTRISLDSKRIVAEKSGHLIPLDQPELVVDVVKQLVDKV